MKMVKFYSNDLEKDISAEILEQRKHTVVLILENGKIIIKKNSQVTFEGF